MTAEEIIKIMKGMIVNAKERAAVEEACKILDDNRWRFVYEDNPETLPPVNEVGDSGAILVSFDRKGCPALVGHYIVDDDGGSFRTFNTLNVPFISLGYIVTAWRPMPKMVKETDG